MIWWVVLFEEGGRLYTYNRTREDMTSYISERFNVRGELPYRIWAIIDGEMQKVEMST